MQLLGWYWVSVIKYREGDYISEHQPSSVSPGTDFLKLNTGMEAYKTHKYWQQFPIWVGDMLYNNDSDYWVDLSQFPEIWAYSSLNPSYSVFNIPKNITRAKRIYRTHFKETKPLCSKCFLYVLNAY